VGQNQVLAVGRVKSTNVSSLNHEMERLERLVADRIGKLKAAVEAGEAMVVEEAGTKGIGEMSSFFGQAEALAGNKDDRKRCLHPYPNLWRLR
jgi:hypothetical protein